jgi:hypothetical protein
MMNSILNRISLLLFLSFLLNGIIPVQGQRFVVKTKAGGSGPLDGNAANALFLSPWQIKVKDTLAFITDKDYGALRQISVRKKIVKTLLTDQKSISGLAISNTGDSIFFCTNDTILKLYRRSTQQVRILDTLPRDIEMDALECTRKGELLIGSAFGQRILLRQINGTYKTLAGKLGVAGFTDGLDTLARFNRIASIVLSRTEDTVFITDRFNFRIRRLIRSTRQVSTLGITALFGPRQLELSRRKDTLLIANSSGHTIYRYALKTNSGGHWCGLNTSQGYVDGLPLASRFAFPMGIARCDSGYLVCDNVNRRIRLIRPSGLVKTFAGGGILGDGNGTFSRFGLPYDLVKHPTKDSVYITDQNNHAIRILNLRNMNVTTAAGNGTAGNVFAIGQNARLNRPSNMAINSNGDSLYFVEAFANKIKLLLTKTNEVKWVAGSDTAGYIDKPLGRFARFNRPSDLALKDGFLYVADAVNHKIRRINLKTTAVTTFAGSTSGFFDSTLLGSKFNRPNTLEWVGNKLFVGEDAGLRIRLVEADSNRVRNWAGNGNIGTVDGIGTQARFKGIFKLTYDPVGKRLLVGGYLNEGVCRSVGISSPWVKTFLSNTGFQDGEIANARFQGPLGFWEDSAGQRYLMVDANNQRIREIRWYPNSAPVCSVDTTLLEMLEDQTLGPINGVAGNVNVGTAPGDTLQTFQFLVSGTPGPSLSSAALTNEGTLSVTPAPDSVGIIRLRLVLKDNGGSGFGGTDSSQYFKNIRVVQVNDAPQISINPLISVPNHLPAKSQLILSAKPGPGNESEQSMAFAVWVENPSLFSSLPGLTQDTISFIPAPGALGSTSAWLKAVDNGGLQNGGVDSLLLPFTIQLYDPVGVKTQMTRKFSVFPNPAESSFTFYGHSSFSSSLGLFNLHGKKIWSWENVQEGQKLFLPAHVSGLNLLRFDEPGSPSTLISIRVK